MKPEYALAIVKPDAIRLGLKDVLRKALLDNGFVIVRSWTGTLSKPVAETLYESSRGKPHFEPQIAFMTEGPVHAMTLTHSQDIDPCPRLRRLIGATMPADREPGSLRALYGDPEIPRFNRIHGSDNPTDGLREIILVMNGPEG
jgi:nucleoside diphosphate kinase